MSLRVKKIQFEKSLETWSESLQSFPNLSLKVLLYILSPSVAVNDSMICRYCV